MSLSLGQSLTYDSVQLAFQITIFSIWGIGADIPVILMRYGKAYPPVLNIHSISMMICGLLTIMYVLTWTISYFTKVGGQLTGANLGAFIISWILCFLIIVQGILGFVLRAQLSSTQLSQNLFTIKWIHRITGVITQLIGKMTVTLNLFAYADSNLFRGFLFLLGAQAICLIVIEIIFRIQTKKCYFKRLVQHTPKNQKRLAQILDNLNSEKDIFDDYKSKGIRYIILDNIMYYIDEQFIHPGGQVIFDLFNGQQINYLFKGTHQLTPDYPRHKHTKYARRFLDMRYVGDLKVTPLLLNQKVENQLIQWKITDIKPVYSDSNLIVLQNPDVIVDDALKVDQFGKYIMLRCPTQQLIRKQYRPYSILKCLSKINSDRLQKYKNQYKHYIYGDIDIAMESSGKKSHNFQSTNSIINSVIHGANNGNKLSFMIKTYSTGVFSSFLVKNKNSKTISITGPFGRGLRLKSHSNGFFVIIAAGTGVLPFIDLFAYLLQKTLLKAIAIKAGEAAAKRVNDQGIDYTPLQGLKILFIGSFQNSKQFYMNEVIKDLYHLNRKHSLNQFDIMLRYNNNEIQPDVKMVSENFNSDFLKTITDMQPERIYYCGPSNLQRDIRLFEKKSQDFKGTFIYV